MDCVIFREWAIFVLSFSCRLGWILFWFHFFVLFIFIPFRERSYVYFLSFGGGLWGCTMQKVIGVTILATANAEKCPLTCSGVCKDPTKPDCAKDQWGCVQFAKGCDEDCDDPKFVLTASTYDAKEFTSIGMDLFMHRRYCKVNTDGCWAVQQTNAHKQGKPLPIGAGHPLQPRWMGSSRASRQKHNSSSWHSRQIRWWTNFFLFTNYMMDAGCPAEWFCFSRCTVNLYLHSSQHIRLRVLFLVSLFKFWLSFIACC